METVKPKVMVLDTSAFIHHSGALEGFTIKEVLDESKAWITKLKCNIPSVKILEPSQKSLQMVKHVIEKSGDKLSETDMKLIALALDLREKYVPVVVTDDYFVQNVCKILEIEFKGIASGGISEVYRWFSYCALCGKVFPPSVQTCRICGSKLKKKPSYSSKLKK